jgi:hypothetical protein
MSWIPPPPNVTDYYNFLVQQIGVPVKDLPPLSEVVLNSTLGFVLDSEGRKIGNAGQDWVNNTLAVALAMVNSQLMAQAIMYNLAVYNYAADRLINFAQDQNGQTWFEKTRKECQLNSQTVGVIASSFDQGTGQSILNPEQMRMFTVTNHQMLKTRPGQAYLGIAQSVGTLYGLS